MKRILFLAVVSSLIFAGNVKADPLLEYTLTGFLTADAGDSAGLNNATVTLTTLFDNTAVYVDRFGLPALPALDASVNISGAANGTNNGLWGFTEAVAFYPTFAGTFTEPTGLFTEFISGTGAQMEFRLNTSPSAGSANAVIGGSVELDDFFPADYTGGGMTNLNTGENYTLNNVSISATKVIPEPGSFALIAMGLVCGLCKRRRAA